MNFCECGCKKEVKAGNRFLHGHNQRKTWPNTQIKFCGCNCGQKVGSGKRFIRGHNARVNNIGFLGKHHSEKAKKLMSEAKAISSPSVFKKGHKKSIGHKNGMFGKHHSEKSKEGQRTATNLRYANGWVPDATHKNFKRTLCWSIAQNKFIHTRSSWETLTIQFLNKFNIPWLYEPKTIKLNDCFYRPDFYLPKTNVWLEVKGQQTDKWNAKLALFRKEYPEEKIIVFGAFEIKRLKTIGG